MNAFERDFFTALFVWPEEVPVAISSLRPDHFENEDLRRLFTAFQATSDSGLTVDTSHVHEALVKAGMSTEAAANLIAIALDGIPVKANLLSYIEKIREVSRKKRLTVLMETTKHRAESGETPESLAADAIQGIWDIQDDLPIDRVREALEVSRELATQAFDERNRPEEVSGISTGITYLDSKTTGIRAGELWIAGALPGRGKTAFAAQVVTYAVTNGIPALFFSLEMSRTELIRRIAGAEVGAWDVRNPRGMSETTWQKFLAVVSDISTWPLFIDDSPSLTPMEIAARSRVAIRRHGVKLIVVDYLQLLRGNGRELRERVGAAANGLRELAKQTGVPVLALSQLRRPSDLNDRPSMIDLKESGDIEAHAHTVLLLYMPMGEDDAPLGEDEIIIGKQRNGPLGSIPVYFDRKTLIFRSREIAKMRMTALSASSSA